jgi:predicted DNA-binding ribbon-helix-helix protein
MSLRPKKRSLTLRGHRTSVSIEDRFWSAFCAIARDRDLAINELAAKIDEGRDIETEGLASAIRDYVLQHFMDHANDQARD